MNILQLQIGKTAHVEEILCDELLTKRLLSLGCIKGTEIKIISIAPLGDPVIINFRGNNLAIRKADAEKIYIHSELD
ncbi:ferrous iron transport protein A [Clostridium sp. 19966]|uniref:FeoA family protein n=1 Tax=Clostridium sp. 19966 TaxID=2768166 RepID=UPI0028DE5DB1|nr:ferrous iron transport protein A [Clostridium sp. 19966]MDT8716337.1 ferrous iron transport protein A [Clostridium sp. 19966]